MSDIVGRVTIQGGMPDGRLVVLVVWPDGEWKTEVFPSMEHLVSFAKANNLEVRDARNSGT